MSRIINVPFAMPDTFTFLNHVRMHWWILSNGVGRA